MPEVPIVLQLLRRTDRLLSPIDGMFAVEYDPTRNGELPEGVPDVLGHLVVTDDPGEARQFTDQIAVLEYWQQPSRRGRGPGDRPLTGYTVAALPVTDFGLPVAGS